MGLLSYIKGNKKGREAHNLEREAMQDPFLADALDGYSNIEDPELDARLRRMDKKIEQYDLRERYIPDDIVAASAMERPHAPAMAMYDMHEVRDAVIQPSGQNHSNRPEKPRRGYMFWISVAAVMILVCTISYELGLISGRGNFEFIEDCKVTADIYERPALESTESVLDTSYCSDNVKTQIAKAECRVNNKGPLYENANELPCPTNGYKAYYEYIYKEMKELATFDSNNISGIVVLNFDIDNSGRPSNIEITESSSETIARKLIDIVRKGERWSGHGKVESFVFIY